MRIFVVELLWSYTSFAAVSILCHLNKIQKKHNENEKEENEMKYNDFAHFNVVDGDVVISWHLMTANIYSLLDMRALTHSTHIETHTAEN